MSAVKLEFDNTLEKSEIIIPIQSISPELANDDYVSHNISDLDQTKVFGILSPLIMINSTVINFNEILSFELKSIGKTPTLNMIVNDPYHSIINIDKPGIDNEVRIQIIPQFDNIYRKINLTFFISNISINDTYVNINCIYKVPKLIESRIESFGNISTYNLFRNIALNTQMGFQTNIADMQDQRFVYCSNKSYLDILDNEIEYSDTTNNILDWWIDFWDNINLVDIKERYNSIDTDDDMKIWISNNMYDIQADTSQIEPQLMPAVILNHPSFNNSELYVNSYVSHLKPGTNYSSGTDNVYTTYLNDSKEHFDYLLQNGDVKNDIFVKYSYLGENYGAYNYLISKPIREKYLQKINSEYITVTLSRPVFGLMRGGKVNFIRYTNDDMLKNRIKELESIEVNGQKLINSKVTSNIPLDDYELDNSEESDHYMLDRTVSGQYLIIGTEINYKNNNWEYKLNLAKPISTNSSLVILEKNKQ